MSFPVTINVPYAFNWQALKEQFASHIQDKGVILGAEYITEHYAYLLRISSWKYEIDWDVLNDVVTLEMPLRGAFENKDTTADVNDVSSGTSFDFLAYILNEVIKKVPIKRVESHFVQLTQNPPSQQMQPKVAPWRRRGNLYSGEN